LSLVPKPRLSFPVLGLRGLTLVLGGLSLFWAITDIARSQVSDDFQDVESRLLQFEAFSKGTSVAVLESAAARDLSPCDNHAQRALMLIEVPLADAALRSGAVQEFDHRIRSLENRARLSLGCTPRDSFLWLLLFGIETEHGVLDEHSFDLLSMSYETSPNEAWIAMRRIVLAIPVFRVAPEPIQQRVLNDFQELIAQGFVESPARAYLRASESTRSMLQSRIDQLDSSSQRNFSEALQRLRS
jgi:hypothetical protein